jgi:hypothetical protein
MKCPPPNHSKAFALWLGTGFTYGFIRKCILLDDAVVNQGDEYDSVLHKRVYYSRPMLFTEKVGIVAFHSIINAYAFPAYVHRDLVMYEARMRGIEFERRESDNAAANAMTTRYPYIWDHIFT